MAGTSLLALAEIIAITLGVVANEAWRIQVRCAQRGGHVAV